MGKYYPKRGITVEDILADKVRYEYVASKAQYMVYKLRWNKTWPLKMFFKVEDEYALAARRYHCLKHDAKHDLERAELQTLYIKERRKEVGL